MGKVFREVDSRLSLKNCEEFAKQTKEGKAFPGENNRFKSLEMEEGASNLGIPDILVELKCKILDLQRMGRDEVSRAKECLNAILNSLGFLRRQPRAQEIFGTEQWHDLICVSERLFWDEFGDTEAYSGVGLRPADVCHCQMVPSKRICKQRSCSQKI